MSDNFENDYLENDYCDYLEDDYCEACGRKIVSPNFVVTRDQGLLHPSDDYCTCAFCELDRIIARYNDFKDEIDALEFHLRELDEINKLIKDLQVK